MSATALSRAFHGEPSMGEGVVPGSGGNLNTVFSGEGDKDPMSSDFGYSIGNFPAGGLPSGSEQQEFRISDSNAFNNLRGIAKTNFPFDPYPAQDHANQNATSLMDNFQESDMAGISSLLPGKFSYNNKQGTLSEAILAEFNAGTSTFNSLPWGESAYSVDMQDTQRRDLGNRTNVMSSGLNKQEQEGINPDGIVQQYRQAYVEPAEQDVPLTPFHKTYPNFAVGKVDYGFQDPGADQASADVIRAYHAVLPEGQLAGTKQELMPVFSGVNQEAVEQRPILQSLGKTKNTLYLGGMTELPDDLRIDPREALKSGSNIPADLVQTAGELASALETLGYHPADGLHTGNPYGASLPNSRTLAATHTKMPDGFYDFVNTSAHEPLIFEGGIYDYTASDKFIHEQ